MNKQVLRILEMIENESFREGESLSFYDINDLKKISCRLAENHPAMQ